MKTGFNTQLIKMSVEDVYDTCIDLGRMLASINPSLTREQVESKALLFTPITNQIIDLERLVAKTWYGYTIEISL